MDLTFTLADLTATSACELRLYTELQERAQKQTVRPAELERAREAYRECLRVLTEGGVVTGEHAGERVEGRLGDGVGRRAVHAGQGSSLAGDIHDAAVAALALQRQQGEGGLPGAEQVDLQRVPTIRRSAVLARSQLS